MRGSFLRWIQPASRQETPETETAKWDIRPLLQSCKFSSWNRIEDKDVIGMFSEMLHNSFTVSGKMIPPGQEKRRIHGLVELIGKSLISYSAKRTSHLSNKKWVSLKALLIPTEASHVHLTVSAFKKPTWTLILGVNPRCRFKYKRAMSSRKCKKMFLLHHMTCRFSNTHFHSGPSHLHDLT